MRASLISGVSPSWSHSRNAASIAAGRLSSQYRKDEVFRDNFWFGGNALHSYIAYCLACGERDKHQLLLYAYNQVYKPALGNPGWWRDDYGWWGNVFCAALRNRNALGYQASEYDVFFGDLLDAAVRVGRSSTPTGARQPITTRWVTV
jgi:hypothetical protein